MRNVNLWLVAQSLSSTIMLLIKNFDKKWLYSTFCPSWLYEILILIWHISTILIWIKIIFNFFLNFKQIVMRKHNLKNIVLFANIMFQDQSTNGSFFNSRWQYFQTYVKLCPNIKHNNRSQLTGERCLLISLHLMHLSFSHL